MANESSFRDLWDLAQSGDQDAQAGLYLEYGPHLRRVIRHKLRDLRVTWATEPDDVLDSFFIRLFKGGCKIRLQDALHFTNYCEKALRNKCLQILRSNDSRMKASLDVCPASLLEEPNSNSSSVEMSWAEELEAAY